MERKRGQKLQFCPLNFVAVPDRNWKFMAIGGEEVGDAGALFGAIRYHLKNVLAILESPSFSSALLSKQGGSN